MEKPVTLYLNYLNTHSLIKMCLFFLVSFSILAASALFSPEILHTVKITDNGAKVLIAEFDVAKENQFLVFYAQPTHSSDFTARLGTKTTHNLATLGFK